ncbi:MAG: hypothetical protein CL693_08325 [Cellvibrionaceae bacterium]|nr:hypothetical protein [Cellvibrionaceae bacterium]
MGVIKNSLNLQSLYFHNEIGLHYDRYRHYEPSVGRLTYQDPVGLLCKNNHYQCASNQTDWFDPTRLTCQGNT